MKYICHLVIFTAVALVVSAQTQAQVNNYFYLDWNINVPTSNTEWIGSTSTAGGKVGYRFFPFNQTERISLGVDFSWTTLYEYAPEETFYYPDGALTTDYFKYLFNNSLVLSGQYYFPLASERIFPYAGIGLGANWNRYRLYYNIYTEEETDVGFLARPEVGVLARFGSRRSLGAKVAMHFDYSTNQSENYQYSAFSALGFQVGILLMNRY